MKPTRPYPLIVNLTRRQAWLIQAMLATVDDDPCTWATRTLCAAALAHISAERQRLAYLFGVRDARSVRRGPVMVPVPLWPAGLAPAIAVPGAMAIVETQADGGIHVQVPMALADLVEQAARLVGARPADWVRLVLVAAAEPTWLPRVI